jgi:hypothetical protein
VVSTKSGVIYEKVSLLCLTPFRYAKLTDLHNDYCSLPWQRVILKYVESDGKDPANGEELSAADLVPVKANKGKAPVVTDQSL